MGEEPTPEQPILQGSNFKRNGWRSKSFGYRPRTITEENVMRPDRDCKKGGCRNKKLLGSLKSLKLRASRSSEVSWGCSREEDTQSWTTVSPSSVFTPTSGLFEEDERSVSAEGGEQEEERGGKGGLLRSKSYVVTVPTGSVKPQIISIPVPGYINV